MQNIHILADFDGVLTDSARQMDPQAIQYLVSLARKGAKVDIATGRGLAHLETDLMPLLQHFCANEPMVLDRFTLNGESGIKHRRFKGGILQPVQESGLGLTPKQMQFFVRVSKKKKFKTLLLASEKTSMFTFRASPAALRSNPRLVASELMALEKLLIPAVSKMQDVRLQRGSSSLDIVSREADKRLIAKRLLRTAPPGTFFLILGDAANDLPIAKEMKKAGASFRFCFVGNPKSLKKHEKAWLDSLPPVRRRTYSSQYNRGTKKVLSGLLRRL